MGDLAKINEYQRQAVHVTGRDNKDGTFTLSVMKGGTRLFCQEYTNKAAFTTALQAIQDKFNATNDQIWEAIRRG